jgi:hypothetical protein
LHASGRLTCYGRWEQIRVNNVNHFIHQKENRHCVNLRQINYSARSKTDAYLESIEYQPDSCGYTIFIAHFVYELNILSCIIFRCIFYISSLVYSCLGCFPSCPCKNCSYTTRTLGANTILFLNGLHWPRTNVSQVKLTLFKKIKITLEVSVKSKYKL